MNSITLNQLFMFSLQPIKKRILRRWYKMKEQHYLMCADVEKQKRMEAGNNERVYAARAAIARSNINTL